jgi:hypothetical protein
MMINGLPEQLTKGQLFRSCDTREYRLVRVTAADVSFVHVRNVRRQHGAPLVTRVNRRSFFADATYTHRSGTVMDRKTGFYPVGDCANCDCCQVDQCGLSPDACTPMGSPVMRDAYRKPGGCPCNTNPVANYRR